MKYESLLVMDALSHWKESRTYPGPSWLGVEALHYELATVEKEISVSSGGWYKYPASTQGGMDGKTWRYVTPSDTVVSCHGIMHDDKWTLSTHVYHSEDSIGEENFIGDEDHWVRVYMWTYAVMNALSTDGYHYSEAKRRLLDRWRKLELLRNYRDKWLPIIESIVGVSSGEVSVGLSYRVPKGKIGYYDAPTALRSYGIISISPKATGDYLETVVKHELIHHVIGGGHGALFQEVARKIGIPRLLSD